MRVTPCKLSALVFASAMAMGCASARAALDTYDVNLTFNAGGTPFSANDVSGLISGPGTITGSFTVDDQTNMFDTVSVVSATGSTQIASYDLGAGYSGLGFGYNLGYTDASFSEPGYESPDFEALFFYPGGSEVYSGDDLFGSKIELYNGGGQRIAEFQLAGSITEVGVPEPVGSMVLVSIGGLFIAKRPRRDSRVCR